MDIIKKVLSRLETAAEPGRPGYTRDPKLEAEASSITQAFIKKAQQILKSKGYKYEGARRQSAQIQWDWSKGEDKIVLDGWHGTGKGNRNYGQLALVMTMYNGPDAMDPKESDTGIFVMPGRKKGDYSAGMPKDELTQEDLDAYKKNIIKAEHYLQHDVK